MSNIVPRTQGGLAPRAGNVVNDELSSGTSSFARLGIKGKVWSVKYNGQETPMLSSDGDPLPSMEFVIVASAAGKSKTWYEKGFNPDNREAPDCFSNNGVKPDPASKKKQNEICATCPRNQFGSKINEQGVATKGKACGDYKTLAVVPATNLRNELYGGPILLRVPGGSLKDLDFYATKLKGLGYPYYEVVTKIRFDPKEAYPKLVFQEMRVLEPEEFDIVKDLRQDPRTVRILGESIGEASDGDTPAPPAAPPLPPRVTPPPPAPSPTSLKGGAVAEVIEDVPWSETPPASPEDAQAGAGAPADFDAMIANLMGGKK